jgi:hypothetical protein
MSHTPWNPRRWRWLLALAVFLGTSLFILSKQPGWALGIGLLQGLAVGTVVGATGLVASYDDAWPDFWHTIGMAAILGIFSLVVYWIKQEEPSAFFWVAWAASLVGYSMLFFVPVLTWVAADLLIWLGTFTGWFFSGLLRPGYD